MKKAIAAVLLLLVLIGSAGGTLYFKGETDRLRTENEALVAAAESRLAAAQAAYNAIDPSTLEGSEHQLETEKAIVAEAVAQADELEKESRAIDEEISRAQQELDALEEQEENAYYLAMYQSLHEGMEKVEDCIEGN